MTLDEFENDLVEECKNFVRNWRDESKIDPDNWPLEMGEGDWWEQFISAASIDLS